MVTDDQHTDDIILASGAPRVEALIASVMAKHSGIGDKAQAQYYEAVHQELAPLARDLERRLKESAQKVDDLAMLVRRLIPALRKAAPDCDLLATALDYLNRSGLSGSVIRADNGGAVLAGIQKEDV